MFLQQLYWPWRANNNTEEDSMFLQAITLPSQSIGMTAPTSPFETIPCPTPFSSKCNSLLFASIEPFL